MSSTPVQHTQARTQDGHNGDLAACDLVHLSGTAPALDDRLLQREVGRSLVSQQARDLAGELAELLGRDLGFTHQADLVLDQGVFDFDDGHGETVSS